MDWTSLILFDSSFNAVVVVGGNTTYVNAAVYAVATAYGPFGCAGGGSCEKVLIGGAFVNFGDEGRDYFARLSQNGTGDYAAETPSLVDAPIKCFKDRSSPNSATDSCPRRVYCERVRLTAGRQCR